MLTRTDRNDKTRSWSASKRPLTTELSFDDNDHERKRERDFPGSGEKVVSPEMEELEGKCAQGGEKPRSSESNSLRIEKETVREADPVFHSSGRSCGRFPR